MKRSELRPIWRWMPSWLILGIACVIAIPIYVPVGLARGLWAGWLDALDDIRESLSEMRDID